MSRPPTPSRLGDHSARYASDIAVERQGEAATFRCESSRSEFLSRAKGRRL